MPRIWASPRSTSSTPSRCCGPLDGSLATLPNGCRRSRSGTPKACAWSSSTSRDRSRESLERYEQLRSGIDSQRDAESEEHTVGNRLFPRHLLRRDQGDANDGADEVGGEESQQAVADPQPSEPESHPRGAWTTHKTK